MRLAGWLAGRTARRHGLLLSVPEKPIFKPLLFALAEVLWSGGPTWVSGTAVTGY